MADVVGLRPFKGDMVFLVNDPGHGIGNEGDGTVPCGLAGNPIRLGTNLDDGRSCMIVASGNGKPQMSVFLHELSEDLKPFVIR